jgi:hypothetical protein
MGAAMLLVGAVSLGCWLLLRLLVNADMLRHILSYLLPTALASVPVVGAAGGEWLYERGQTGSRDGWWRCGVAGWFWGMLAVLLYYIGTEGPAAIGIILVVFCTYLIPIHGIVLGLAMTGALLVRLVKYCKKHAQRTH